MSFDKKYFDSLNELLEEYEREVEPKSGIVVTVHHVTSGQYPMAKVLEATDSVVSFYCYEKNVNADVLPLVSIPYSMIAAVQVEPSSARSKFGFQKATS